MTGRFAFFLVALRFIATLSGKAAGLLARFAGRFVRESLQALTGFARERPRMAFLGAVLLAVFFAFLVPSLYLHSPPAPPPQQQQEVGQQHEAAPPLLGVRPVVSGPLRVGERENVTGVTLGGVLPPGRVLVVEPSPAEPSAWGNIWATRQEEVRPVAATVTWPLGGKYTHLAAQVGFLPPKGSGKPGGKYELFLDGRKVWETVVTADDAAMGRAADRPLELDLSGARVLTLRVQALSAAEGKYSFTPTVPYPLALYEIALTPAQQEGGAGNGATQG
ncbi:NPCBM/NEW2 domain-containing protein [Desulfovirgula thermocuniculi]|uniref:NPCBM/NEW2 domain-containing protein n=1 Tax=Desulfovirgula thermocuniculi TaxID=348842 RepID=UPI0003F5D282|nr:NPCBM/NEW2 domain-containing protein [Desulfovirgula thermocuniculi]